jgi:hypothetical protein
VHQFERVGFNGYPTEVSILVKKNIMRYRQSFRDKRVIDARIGLFKAIQSDDIMS